MLFDCHVLMCCVLRIFCVLILCCFYVQFFVFSDVQIRTPLHFLLFLETNFSGIHLRLFSCGCLSSLFGLIEPKNLEMKSPIVFRCLIAFRKFFDRLVCAICDIWGPLIILVEIFGTEYSDRFTPVFVNPVLSNKITFSNFAWTLLDFNPFELALSRESQNWSLNYSKFGLIIQT